MSKPVLAFLLIAAGATGLLYSFLGAPPTDPSSSGLRLPSSPRLALAEEENVKASTKPAERKKVDKGTAAAVPATTEKTYPAQDPSKGALEGRIVFEGELPELKVPEIRRDHAERATCLGHLKNEQLILSKKGEIKDVVVSVAKYKPKKRVKPRAVRLENKDCTFVPHVLATTTGSRLTITNTDAFLHNTRAVLAASFNRAVGPGSELVQTLRKPGWAPIGCDIHPWMKAHIWIFAHDLFDVTGTNGAYRIPNIPPGEYDIEYWHEYPLKRQTKKVTIEAGKTTQQDVIFRKQVKK